MGAWGNRRERMYGGKESVLSRKEARMLNIRSKLALLVIFISVYSHDLVIC